MLFFTISQAQSLHYQQGVIYSKGANSRIGQVAVFNARTKFTVNTDNLGRFSILSLEGDTLQFSKSGYLGQGFIVSDFRDVLIYMAASNELSEVIVIGKSIKNELKEVEDMYRSKGIYYNGKPPAYLLSPIDGKPLTFLYERFGKEGKRARKFSQFAKKEIEYSEVRSRFNDHTIRTVIDICEKELNAFKEAYFPTSLQIKSWTDFDLYNYIKKSYTEFKKDKIPCKD